jgi:hypothetical protein
MENITNILLIVKKSDFSQNITNILFIKVKSKQR